MLEKITPLILTYNEAPNIAHTLKRLTWAERIIAIDSFSTDETLDILYSIPQVQVYKRKFDTHANQWNYGLQQINSEWVLSLDADYIVSSELIFEIKELPQDTTINGYFARFKYCVYGKSLRGTILPPRQVLFRKDKSIYIDDGHTQLLQIEGKSAMLSSYIHHDDRKSLSRWLWAQDRYILIEVKKLLETPVDRLSWGDRIRKQKVLAPFIILIYCLILKGGIFDGWRGWYYALQRVLVEILLAIRLIETENFKKIEANSLLNITNSVLNK